MSETARIAVHLNPRASRDEIGGFAPAADGQGEVLRVRVAEPPVVRTRH
ncbi:MAG TPA: hypothetical protein QGI71_04505 [Dehalococcoidia bacterium]|jgi:uncharacterized protein YggU (UPF0235/DUF167 family)|nr:hypothetical protein [Dehalococcoidia bacterium]